MSLLDATGIALGDLPRHRIVSLVPSLTEALFSLGAGERVIGVTQFCEEPAERVQRLPKVGGTKTPDLDAIVALQPDVVVASSEENRREDVLALREAGISVFVTHYPTVQTALDGMSALALLAGARTPDWLDRANRLVRELAAQRPRGVRYFCPIWRNPYMVARRDTYMSDLLALAGGENVFSGPGPAHYYTVDLHELAALAPEVILLPDEPYRFARRHLSDLRDLSTVPAIANGQVHFVDGKALTWYGPRTADGLEHFVALFAGVAAGSHLHAV